MENFKKLISWIVANKKSLTGTVIGAIGAGAGVTAAWTLESIPEILIRDFNFAPILYTVVCVVAFIFNELGICGKGFESITAYIERREAEKAEAEAKAIEKEALKQIVASEEEAKKIQAEAEKQILADKQKAKEEERAKLIEQKKAEILANSNK